MKYFSIIILLITGSYLHSQSIKDNKVSIDYIQLPKKKVDQTVSTFFTIYKDSYNNQNSRQLSVYQFKVDPYSSITLHSTCQPAMAIDPEYCRRIKTAHSRRGCAPMGVSRTLPTATGAPSRPP